MKLDRDKLKIAMARTCMNVGDIIKIADMPRPSFNNAYQGKEVRPATLGRIAKALGVDVTEIMKEEEA